MAYVDNLSAQLGFKMPATSSGFKMPAMGAMGGSKKKDKPKKKSKKSKSDGDGPKSCREKFDDFMFKLKVHFLKVMATCGPYVMSAVLSSGGGSTGAKFAEKKYDFYDKDIPSMKGEEKSDELIELLQTKEGIQPCTVYYINESLVSVITALSVFMLVLYGLFYLIAYCCTLCGPAGRDCKKIFKFLAKLMMPCWFVLFAVAAGLAIFTGLLPNLNKALSFSMDFEATPSAALGFNVLADAFMGMDVGFGKLPGVGKILLATLLDSGPMAFLAVLIIPIKLLKKKLCSSKRKAQKNQVAPQFAPLELAPLAPPKA
jgi:hypothetical protein